MKKIFLLLLTFTLSLTLIGCDKEPVEIDTTLYTTYTDELVMDFEYESTEFIADGIGVVTFVSCTDGDTALFSSGGQTFPVRFLGIDTPESTYRYDPWGKSASAYTCDKLTNAETIVLESENERTDGYDRYLAWVWYDGRLLNLELIEQAYSVAKSAAGSKYEDIVYDAELKTQPTKRRVWGEEDPDFDYSLEGVQVTIEELVTNQSEYEGLKVVITGTVTSLVGNSPFIEQDGFGVYVYIQVYTTKMAVGNSVTMEGLTPAYYPDAETGALQLVSFTSRNAVVNSTDNEVLPTLKEVKDLTILDIGSYSRIEGLKVLSIFTSTNTGDHTIACEDEFGNEIDVHVQSRVSRTEINAQFVVGSYINVVAPLSTYFGRYQMEMGNLDGVSLVE